MKKAKNLDATKKSKFAKKQSDSITRELFEKNLHDLYWCEKQLSELLPEFSRLATSYELASAILAHLAVTENQLIRLIHVFDAIGERAVGNECEAISAILESHPLTQNESGFERDTKIITVCQEIMKYEIDTYTFLHSCSLHLNEELAGEFLATAIKEEKNTQRRLNEISLSSIYFDAAS